MKFHEPASGIMAPRELDAAGQAASTMSPAPILTDGNPELSHD